MGPKQEKKQKINGLESIYKSQSETNSLIIAVSVGGKAFEGESLSALVEAINELAKKKPITHCTIAIGDTLQRHNYQINGQTNDAVAFNKSKEAGNEWLKKNDEIIKKLTPSHSIIRWNKWLKDKRYDNAHLKISTLYDNDSSFQQAIQCSIDSFSDRFIKQYEGFGFKEPIIHEVLKNSCRAYLLEECAIIMQLWPTNKENHCEYLLYPGKMTKALAYAYDKIIQKKDLFKWNKFAIKKNPTAKNGMQFNSEEKIKASTNPCITQEKCLLILAIAACESITTSPHYSSKEKVNMLSSFTGNVVHFFSSATNNTLGSISKEEKKFPENNI